MKASGLRGMPAALLVLVSAGALMSAPAAVSVGELEASGSDDASAVEVGSDEALASDEDLVLVAEEDEEVDSLSVDELLVAVLVLVEEPDSVVAVLAEDLVEDSPVPLESTENWGE